MAIDKLSEDVLLEIFDAYRQLYESDPSYEYIWNSGDGWFKLTHVCRSWRRLVHLSPSRLHVHVLFTPCRSTTTTMLGNLPSFPILVEFRRQQWTKRELNLALAIEHRARVRGIFLRPRSYVNTINMFKMLSRPFPELESLEIRSHHNYDLVTLPNPFILGSPSRLRRLKLRNVEPRCLTPLLSTVTGLVELALTLRVFIDKSPEKSLIAVLHRMPCLRRLELRLRHLRISDIPRPPARTENIVPLPNLMEFVFTGHHIFLEALVAGLAAPSLQHLDVWLVGGKTFTFPIPHLCKFVCDTDNYFGLVRLEFWGSGLRFTAETRPISVHAFRISTRESISLEGIGDRLSGPISTVEELQVVIGQKITTDEIRSVQWHGFFNHLPQVKVLRVPWQMALDVAHSFQQNGQEPAMDILPDLGQINMDMTYWHPPPVAISDVFEPLIAARKKVGRPITLSLT